MGIVPESDSVGLGVGPGNMPSNQGPVVNQIQEDWGPHFRTPDSMAHKGLFKMLNIEGVRAPQSQGGDGEESAAPKNLGKIWYEDVDLHRFLTSFIYRHSGTLAHIPEAARQAGDTARPSCLPSPAACPTLTLGGQSS